MKKERFIFDLDGTLLTGDFGVEHNFFRNFFGEEAEKFLPYIGKYLNEYENQNLRYNIFSLSRFMTEKTGLNFSPDVIYDWAQLMKCVPDKMEKGVLETLTYLKCSGKSLVVLTNWFEYSQKARLQKAGIYDYFDEVITGDICLKPHRTAYFKAIGDYKPEECLFIGDHVENDYIGPRRCGMDSVLYDKEDIHSKQLVKVKRINDIMRMY